MKNSLFRLGLIILAIVIGVMHIGAPVACPWLRDMFKDDDDDDIIVGSSGEYIPSGHHIEIGSLWAWGCNNYGQLGLGDSGQGTERVSPTKITDTDWTMVAIGGDCTIALKTDGTLWGWGLDNYGQLGQGGEDVFLHEHAILTPTRIGIDTNWAGAACAKYHTIAWKTDNTLWAWGYNYGGGLGIPYDNDNRYVRTPTQIGVDTDWSWVDCGNRHNIAVKTNGTLWSWGPESFGELGGGGDAWSPGQVGIDIDWPTVSTSISAGTWCSAAIKTDNTLWAWGQNNWGQLGFGEWHDDDTAYTPTPTQVGTDTNWAQISVGGDHMLALKTDGTLWVWGYNCWGQLGFGDSGFGTQRVSPTKLGTDTDWVAVEARWLVSFARKSDGTVWAWGYNADGQLGDGTTEHRDTPVQVFP